MRKVGRLGNERDNILRCLIEVVCGRECRCLTGEGSRRSVLVFHGRFIDVAPHRHAIRQVFLQQRYEPKTSYNHKT